MKEPLFQLVDDKTALVTCRECKGKGEVGKFFGGDMDGFSCYGSTTCDKCNGLGVIKVKIDDIKNA